MYNSPACWTCTKMVDDELKKLKSKSEKLKSLKCNIKMRVNGFGWYDLHTPWSQNSKDLTIQQLITHLKKILREEKKRHIPLQPPVLLPCREKCQYWEQNYQG